MGPYRRVAGRSEARASDSIEAQHVASRQWQHGMVGKRRSGGSVGAAQRVAVRRVLASLEPADA
jgi:hypothetical protein